MTRNLLIRGGFRRALRLAITGEQTPQRALARGSQSKLGRLVRLFDHLAFAQWIRLEADPAALTFRERPARVDPEPDSCIIDFWVLRPSAQAIARSMLA